MSALLPRPSILSIEPYVGGESKIPGVNRIIKLSSNEGAFGVPPAAQAAYTKLATELHRYPDGGSTALRQAIGARFGLDPARIVCGNGSDELIGHIIMAYGGEGTELVMSAHGFVMYDIAGRYAGCRIIKVPERNLTADVDAMLAAVGPRTRLLFLANPNNPTGTMLPASEVTRLRTALREDVLLVLDAAYAEYVTREDYDAGVALVEAGTNTIMTRTFSKVFGLGGVRLGWTYAPPHITDVLNRVRGPFNVNAPAAAAGVAALAEAGWVEKSVAHNSEWRAKVSDGLRALGVTVVPSEGNFILADFGSAERAQAADAALKARGLIVRAMASYSLPQCLRITIGTAEECGMVLDALTAFCVVDDKGGEPLFERLCLIGVGLVGSSIARAARARGDIARTVVAHTRKPGTLARVRELGFADVVEGDAAAAVRGADCVILCVPVGAYAGVMATIAPYLAPGCVLSDVGSTKGSVIRDLAPRLPPGVHLVPAHPMAGTEHSGPDAGFADLFRGRYVILTPVPGGDAAAVEKVAELWRRCGSMVESMDAATHDKVVAIVSHLPHLIAFTICGTADDLAEETREAVLKFAASGFRDFTRIASSDVDMWRDIFLNNREALLEMLARFTEDSHALARAVRWGEAGFIEDRIRRGRRIRRGLIERKQA